MHNSDFAPASWRKSRHSSAINCVEIAEAPGVIGVRDSKDPHGPVLRYPTRTWGTFLTALKHGEFDRTAISQP